MSDKPDPGSDQGRAAPDAQPPAPAADLALPGRGARLRAGALWAVVWTLVGGALGQGAAMALERSGLGPIGPGGVAALGLALSAPWAVMLAAAAVMARIDETARRVSALHRQLSRIQADLPRRAARAFEADPGKELARAMAGAAREALDAERAAMARAIAEIGETQRRLDAVARALGDGRAAAPASSSAGQAAAHAQAAASAEQVERQPAPGAARAPAPTDEAQAVLPLADERAAPGWPTIVAALEFPRDESDAAGFAALEAAVRDPVLSELLQAAEDTLTLLAQHGLYAEDLSVNIAPFEDWARFAAGARGPEVAAVGGVRNPEAVEAVRRLIRSDPIFRDTAMHLMRRFDRVLRRAVDDPEGAAHASALADTRTGRAFMLVAQAMGVFD
ncbi:hypothetical protein [Oceanicella actignis]|uniref:Uncharacterized protein n=1 Tax=Oceanicella actignis TaxID=1189325 RepID=A0A1M7TSU9_9RHOB|nr:hypothetical protein [Oceanicella actignis]SET76217.1 hypothetical protein SAMN04488119_10919 [Oceanicella actignis]SHN73795.1 hypothetical protein SAMN05216200_109103 [Oceanicella actignis]